MSAAADAAPAAAATTTVHYVSCLLQNPADHASPAQRLAWLQALFSYGPLPMTLYVDSEYASQISVEDHPGLTLVPWSLEDSDVAKRVRAASPADRPLRLPSQRNGGKDTEFFMTLMHCKAELVARTAASHGARAAPFYAFLDAGIVKIFQDGPTSVNRLRTLRPSATALAGRVLIPGCWTPGIQSLETLAARICWVFCGGCFVLEAATAPSFQAAQARSLQQFLDLGWITWEVNTWVHMLQDETAPRFAWFATDHNDRMVNVPEEFLERENGVGTQ